MEAASKSVHVSIFGEDYPLRGGKDTDPEYMARVAEYVDSSMRKIADRSPSLPTAKIAVLAALNITDELFACRRDAEQKLQEVETKAHGILEWLDERLSVGSASDT